MCRFFSYKSFFLKSVWITTVVSLSGAMFLSDKDITFLLFVPFKRNFVNGIL